MNSRTTEDGTAIDDSNQSLSSPFRGERMLSRLGATAQLLSMTASKDVPNLKQTLYMYRIIPLFPIYITIHKPSSSPKHRSMSQRPSVIELRTDHYLTT